MTTTKQPDLALRRRVLELCGWTVGSRDNQVTDHFGWPPNSDTSSWGNLKQSPEVESSLDAFNEHVLSVIEAGGGDFIADYLETLINLTVSEDAETYSEGIWSIFTATAEQRCRAVVRVMEKGE